MGTTNKEDQELLSEIMSLAIPYVTKNYEVYEIFDEKEIVAWVTNNKSPDDVFPDKDLIEWAENNGYSKE